LYYKIGIKENKKNEAKNLKHRINILKVALNAAKEYFSKKENSLANIEENEMPISIEDAISKALIKNLTKKQSLTSKAGDAESEDYNASMDDDSQSILDYIERFNDLFEDGKYHEAAYFAVASPNNILRNIQTTFRFKGINVKSLN
jgi:hypothetical protein